MSVYKYATGKSDLHGYGLFATQILPIGSLIFSEAPILSIQAVPDLQAAVSKQEERFVSTALNLNKTDFTRLRLLVQRRHGSKIASFTTDNLADRNINVTNMLYDTFFSLSFPQCEDKSDRHRLFEDVSKLNNSCRPNAEMAWCEAKQRMAVRAIREIRPRQEILVSYLAKPFVRIQQRRDKLGFDCRCKDCIDTANHPLSDVWKEEIDNTLEDLNVFREESVGSLQDIDFYGGSRSSLRLGLAMKDISSITREKFFGVSGSLKNNIDEMKLMHSSLAIVYELEYLTRMTWDVGLARAVSRWESKQPIQDVIDELESARIKLGASGSGEPPRDCSESEVDEENSHVGDTLAKEEPGIGSQSSVEEAIQSRRESEKFVGKPGEIQHEDWMVLYRSNTEPGKYLEIKKFQAWEGQERALQWASTGNHAVADRLAPSDIYGSRERSQKWIERDRAAAEQRDETELHRDTGLIEDKEAVQKAIGQLRENDQPPVSDLRSNVAEARVVPEGNGQSSYRAVAGQDKLGKYLVRWNQNENQDVQGGYRSGHTSSELDALQPDHKELPNEDAQRMDSRTESLGGERPCEPQDHRSQREEEAVQGMIELSLGQRERKEDAIAAGSNTSREDSGAQTKSADIEAQPQDEKTHDTDRQYMEGEPRTESPDKGSNDPSHRDTSGDQVSQDDDSDWQDDRLSPAEIAAFEAKLEQLKILVTCLGYWHPSAQSAMRQAWNMARHDEDCEDALGDVLGDLEVEMDVQLVGPEDCKREIVRMGKTPEKLEGLE